MNPEESDDPIQPARRGLRVTTEITSMLSSRKRIEILCALVGHTLSVSQLAHALEYEVSDVCKQLKPLRRCGLVRDLRVKKDHLQSLLGRDAVTLKESTLRIEIHALDGSKVVVEHHVDGFLLKRLARSRVDSVRRRPENGGARP